MEYVVIKWAASRKVRIDGQDAGFTNDTLRVEKGHHIFDLGDPRDYLPASIALLVEKTTSVGPLIIGDFLPSRGVV
jgi:hypothetical protein